MCFIPAFLSSKFKTPCTKARSFIPPAHPPENAPCAIPWSARFLRAFLAPTTKHNLFILEEPTIGLHMADVQRLVEVIQRLVEAGHSVVVIEHNLDLIAEADWVIDLGPEAGAEGGTLVAQGTPEEVARAKGSHTGRFLADVLAG